MSRTITADGLAFQPTQSGKNLKWWCVLCHGKNAKSYRRRTVDSVAALNEAWAQHLNSHDHKLSTQVADVTDLMRDA